jgi:hypothetical protein
MNGMCENRVQKRIFRPNRVEGVVDYGKLHNEELHNLFALPNISRGIKSKRTRCSYM